MEGEGTLSCRLIFPLTLQSDTCTMEILKRLSKEKGAEEPKAEELFVAYHAVFSQMLRLSQLFFLSALSLLLFVSFSFFFFSLL